MRFPRRLRSGGVPPRLELQRRVGCLGVVVEVHGGKPSGRSQGGGQRLSTEEAAATELSCLSLKPRWLVYGLFTPLTGRHHLVSDFETSDVLAGTAARGDGNQNPGCRQTNSTGVTSTPLTEIQAT